MYIVMDNATEVLRRGRVNCSCKRWFAASHAATRVKDIAAPGLRSVQLQVAVGRVPWQIIHISSRGLSIGSIISLQLSFTFSPHPVAVALLHH